VGTGEMIDHRTRPLHPPAFTNALRKTVYIV
jgi:hypothetical protein